MKPAISPKRRYPSGQIIEADTEPKLTQEQKWGVAMFQRSKMGATAENVHDVWGAPLGMMRMWAVTAKDDGEGLSEVQYSALMKFCTLRSRFSFAEDSPKESPPSPALTMVSAGSVRGVHEGEPERDAEDAWRFRDAENALKAYGPHGYDWLRVAYQVARDEDSGHEHQDKWRAKLPAVRCAANVLARHFGMM